MKKKPKAELTGAKAPEVRDPKPATLKVETKIYMPAEPKATATVSAPGKYQLGVGESVEYSKKSSCRTLSAKYKEERDKMKLGLLKRVGTTVQNRPAPKAPDV